jgi:glycerate kinase
VTKILIAPDSFKGSISALDAAKEIATGWRSVRPEDEVSVIPLADGGEGTLDAISFVRGGTYIQKSVMAPDGRSVDAKWLLLDDGTALVELASASGLPLMNELAPLTAHTSGFGELLKDAALHPLTKRIIATVGGSASTDGGAGALSALGFSFFDHNNQVIELGGSALSKVRKVDSTKAIAAPSGGVVVLTDVTNPLLGPKGAAAIFAPQKGASQVEIEVLESALHNFAKVIGGDSDAPGAGAAGGTSFGLATLWGAQIQSGASYLFDALGINEEIKSADLVITGEGALDSQSWDGKVIGTLAKITELAEKHIWAIVGIDKSSDNHGPLGEVISLTELAGDKKTATNDASHWLQVAGRNAAELFNRESN